MDDEALRASEVTAKSFVKTATRNAAGDASGAAAWEVAIDRSSRSKGLELFLDADTNAAGLIAAHAVRLAHQDESHLFEQRSSFNSTDFANRMNGGLQIRLAAISRSGPDATAARLVADWLSASTQDDAKRATVALVRLVTDGPDYYAAHLTPAWYAAAGDKLLRIIHRTPEPGPIPSGEREVLYRIVIGCWRSQMFGQTGLARDAGITRATLSAWISKADQDEWASNQLPAP